MAKKAGTAKKSGAGFFLEKGEKLILGVGIGLTGLLLLLGVMSLSDVQDPKKMIADLTTHAQRVNKEVEDNDTQIEPLPPWVTTPPGLKYVGSDQFPLANPPFEPVHQPNMLKENPRVLTPVSSQIDTLRFPMRSLDVTVTPDNETLIGVLTTAPKKELNPDAVKMSLSLLTRRLAQSKPGAKKPPPPPRPPVPGFPPGGGLPGGIPTGGFPGGEGGEPGFGSGFPLGGQRDDRSVSYKTPQEIAGGSYTMAETVYPLQAVMVQAAFPMQAQIEEIKRALRLRSAQDALAAAQAAGPPMASQPAGGFVLGGPQQPAGGEGGAGGAPGVNPALSVGIQFAGFEVQKRTITASGEDYGWAPFDHVDAYVTAIYSRYRDFDPDDPYLTPFLRYDQMMAEPLPQLAEGLGKYPPLRLPQIVKAINDMKAAMVTVPNPTEFEMRFRKAAASTNNPFLPLGSASLGAAFGQSVPQGVPGQPGFPAPGMPGAPGINPNARPGAPGFPPPGLPGATGIPGTFNVPTVDYTLIRFLDPTVQTGFTYEYKLRVKMKNPNYGRPKEVQKKSDADALELYGPWWTVGDIKDNNGTKEFVAPSPVTVPPDSFLYAVDTGKYLEKSDELVKEVGKVATDQGRIKALLETREMTDGRRAVVQFQRWLPQVRATGDKSEPVGTWVVAEMPVAPGEFVGKRQLIKLPLWSAASGASGQYVLRELAGGVRVKGIEDKNQPKGWPVTFRPRPSMLLVDFDGGQVRARSGNREITEEASTELLLLGPDGKLAVKSSADDMQDPKRVEREKTWTEWIDRVKTRLYAPPADPMGLGGEGGRPSG